MRRELDQFFSTLPSVAEGFQLRTWRGGPQEGQPKLPPAARTLVDRGLMRIDRSSNLPRLFFTEGKRCQADTLRGAVKIGPPVVLHKGRHGDGSGVGI